MWNAGLNYKKNDDPNANKKVKNSEKYDEDLIHDCLVLIMAARKKKKKRKTSGINRIQTQRQEITSKTWKETAVASASRNLKKRNCKLWSKWRELKWKKENENLATKRLKKSSR